MDKANEETAGNSKYHKRNRKRDKKCKPYKMTLKKRYSKALFIMAKIENNLRKGREDARDKNSRIECEQVIEEYNSYMKTLGKETKEKRDRFLEEKGSDNINTNFVKKTIEEVDEETEIRVEQKPNEPKEGIEIMADKVTANVPTTGTSQASTISSTEAETFPDDLRMVLASVNAKGLIQPVWEEWPDIELKLNDMLMYYLLHNKDIPIPRYKSGDIYQGFLLIQCHDSYTKDFLSNSISKISKQFPELHLTIIPASEISLTSTKVTQSSKNPPESKHKNSSLTLEMLKDFDREKKAEMDYYKYLKTLEYYNTLETLSKGQRKKQRIYKNYIEKYEQQQQGRDQPNRPVSEEKPQGFQLSVNYFEEDNKQQLPADEPAKENPYNLGNNKISEVGKRILAKKRIRNCSRLRNFNPRDHPQCSQTAQSSSWNNEVNSSRNFNKMPECSGSRNFSSPPEFPQTSTGNMKANSRRNSPDYYTKLRDERDQETAIYSRSRKFNSTAVRMADEMNASSRSRNINTFSLTSSEIAQTGNLNDSDSEGIDNEMPGYSQSRDFNQTAQQLDEIPQTSKRNMNANYPCNSNDSYEKMANNMPGCSTLSNFNTEAQTYTEFPQTYTRNAKFDNENALYSRSRNLNSFPLRMADEIQECSRSRNINTSALATSEFLQTSRWNKEANSSWNSDNSYAGLDNEMPGCSKSRNFDLTAQALTEFPRTLLRNMEDNSLDSKSRNFNQEASTYPEFPQASRSNLKYDDGVLLYSRSRNFDSFDLRSSEIAETSRRQNWNSNVSCLEKDNENSAIFRRGNSSPSDVPAYSRRSQPPAAHSKESHELTHCSRGTENAHPSEDLEKEIVKAKLEQNILECLNTLNEEIFEEEPEDILKELPKKVGDYPSSSFSKLKRKADDLQSKSSTSNKQVNSPLEVITISDDESDNSDIEEVIKKSENLRKDREEYYKALSYLKSLKSRNPLTLSEREIRLQEYYKRRIKKFAQNSHNKDESERQRKPLWNSTKKSNPDLQIAIIDRNEKDFRIPEQCWYQIENRLRESLLREIEQTNNANIGQFDSMYWRYGIKIIQCENPESLEFIKRFIHNQDLYWPGTEYDVIPVRDLPKRSIVKVWLPPPMIEDQAALKLLKAQNSKFYTYDWTLMNSREREDKNGKDLYISISATCLERLRKRNGEIRYGTNTLQVILPPEEKV